MKFTGNGKFGLGVAVGVVVGAVVFGGGTVAIAAGVTAAVANSKIVVNGREIRAEAYNINGANYVKLRDIASAANFSAVYDVSGDRVIVDTSRGYDPNEVYAAAKPVVNAPNVVTGVVVYSDANKPVLGATPGKIMVDNPDPAKKGAGNYEDAYSYGSIGQCTWYAKARFTEVHGLPVNTWHFGDPKDWLTEAAKRGELSVITNVSAIKPLTIAVFAPFDKSQPGHVAFVEYVERDGNGNPTFVYFTESNGSDTLNQGKYDPGYDGVVRKLSFEEFKCKGMGTLLGYIAVK